MERGGIDPAMVDFMDRSTVKLRFIREKNKLKKFTTGFFIGKIDRLAIIFSVAHLVAPMPDIEYSDKAELEAVCYGSDKAYPCCVELLIPESEILILSCFTDKKIEHFFEFAPKEEWEGIKGQKIVSTSHPFGREYRVAEGIVSSSNYLNGKNIPHYDPNLIFFDHNMAMGVGSSGAGILNLNKKVLGMQSGVLLLEQKFVSARPCGKAYNSMKMGNKENDKDLAVSGSSLRTSLHNLNYAVHIAYLDAVLRERLSYLIKKDEETISLNKLVVKGRSFRRNVEAVHDGNGKSEGYWLLKYKNRVLALVNIVSEDGCIPLTDLWGLEELLDWDMGLGIDHPDFMDVALPMEAPDHVNFDTGIGLAGQMNNLGLGQVDAPQMGNLNGMAKAGVQEEDGIQEEIIQGGLGLSDGLTFAGDTLLKDID
ncbi:hypothetical protein POM88_028316 [Heracleum sosnowskyi]|uniref:Uncharacterized protein n=1 Tax=Heracleum sosnowskyi TaxID=360622 RepID=A0AAD8MQQ5_9APIA|nr:hypothetical protein POM88_028316 [Heracleum sosnowskyi]